MPQLDVSTFVPQLFWLAVTFGLLLLLMARVGLPRVGGLIEARRRRVDEDLARAAQLKTEAEAALAAYQEALAKARAEAQAAVKADEAARRKHDTAITDLRGKISKYRDQSLDVKTNEQYKALLAEIQFAEKEIRINEDRILEVMVVR